MSRRIHKLSARAVDALREHGRHGDGGGLYFVVTPNGARKWSFLYRERGTSRQREMGLGSYPEISLARAREKAAAARRQLADGLDPIANRIATGSAPTFEAALDEYIRSHGRQWKNAKHRQQWKNAIAQHAPKLMKMQVNRIETEHVFKPLDRIWTSKPETASRIRGRIENVLDAAKAAGHRTGENPARWRGHLKNLLPKRKKLARGHHPAMPWKDVPAFMTRLQKLESVSARALELTILCATRTTETLEAQWDEFDLEARLWTVPMERTKSGREHRVPLTARAVEIIDEMSKAKRSQFVFPGQKKNRPLSNMSMENVLRRMKVKPYTVHGFRSSFKDWASEATEFPSELAELALAHVVGDETERAYRRGDALDRRQKLMEGWELSCLSRKDNPSLGSAASQTDAVAAAPKRRTVDSGRLSRPRK